MSTLAENAPNYPDGKQLAQAVIDANQNIIDAARLGKGREGMGTTCTAAILSGERLVIAHVGDSRAYLLHQGTIQQITRDHSLMADLIEAGQITKEEARTHPNRSVITRALGSDPHTQPDMYEINVSAGDRILICSDGLTTMLYDKEVATVLRSVHNPQDCANTLVERALDAGGVDNVTVVVVDVSGNSEVVNKKVRRKTKAWVIVFILALIAILAGTVFGVNYLLSHSAYLANEDGKVAIYEGRPGSFLGFSFSHLEEVTNISVDDLNPGVAQKVEENSILLGGVDEAQEWCAETEKDIKSKESKTA